MELTRAIYVEARQMPRDEIFALTSQMRRASSSVPMNIAEGFGKHTRPEFLKGLRTAVGSLFELMTAYEIATSMDMIKPTTRALELLAEEDRLLNALIRSLDAKTKAESAIQQAARRKRL